jgi:acetyl esterase/lipase
MKPPKFLWRDREMVVTTQQVACPDGEKITCFVLSPKNLTKKAPCLLYLHGGGFVLEAAGYHYANAMRYAKEVGCKVVFPLYRLAPRHPHPVFFEDCYAAFCWAYDHGEALGIDTTRIGIGGDSAGSTLAVGVCLMARERKHPVRFRFQMLPYPFLDARNSSDSCKRFTDTPMWNSSLSQRIAPMTNVDRSNPNYVWYSPVEAKSFENLPPAYIETAEFDCLHDDGILYDRLLRDAGIDVTLNETKGTMHGFDIAQKAPTTLAVMTQRIAFMKRMI